MSESDIPTWVLTGAVAVTTFLVYRATKQVAKATKEMTRTAIRPKPSIIHHQLKGEDVEYHHYQFMIKNQGVGDAFDVRIKIIDKVGSSQPYPIQRLRKGQRMGFTATTISKSKDPVKMNISYKDLTGYLYSEDIEYDISNTIFYPQEFTEDI